MFCSVIGCLQSDTDNGSKLLPKDQLEMNVWSKFVKFRSLAICKDNKICESHYNQYIVQVQKVLMDTLKNASVESEKKRISDDDYNSDASVKQVEKKNCDDGSNEDTEYVCRLCGKAQSHFMKSLFTPEIASTPGFHDLIICYFEIRILKTDNVKTICSNCIRRIRSIIAYRTKCQEVNKVDAIKIDLDSNENNEEDNKPEFEFVASNSFNSYDQAATDSKLVIKSEIIKETEPNESEKLIEENGFDENNETEDETDEDQFYEAEHNKKIEIEDDNTNFKHKCNHCQKFLRTRTALRSHAPVCRLGGIWKGNVKFRQTCPICNKKVMKLKQHIVFHSRKKNFICKICDNKFYVAASLNEHMESHNEKKIKCPDCDELFNGPIHLRRHKIRHNESAMRHMCEFCSRKFIRPVELRMHIGVFHNGEKAFKCDECSKTFNYRNMLHRHVEKVHNTNINIGRTNRISKLFLNYKDK